MNADPGALIAAARTLSAARSVAVLTGAGISAESGVPTFRGAQGLWRSFRPEQLATPEAFERDPELVWEWYRWRRTKMASVAPNPGHLVLARMERRFPAFTVVTQNIDGLHALAGSRNLVELHGSIWRDRCTENPQHLFERGREAEAGAPVAPQERAVAPRCHCGGLLRPDVVWFGEALDPRHVDAAVQAAERAEVLLVVGTSSVVYPAAALPGVARRAGAQIVEINPEPTPLSVEADLVLRGRSGDILPELERLV